MADDVAMKEMEEAMTALLTAGMTVWADPAHEAGRSGEHPQPMYHEWAATCPVREMGERVYSINGAEDLRFLARHPDVVQGTKYLGSDRPAIPLGLDGEEHRMYRRLLDPSFAPARVKVLEPRIRARAHELIDEFVDAGTADVHEAWCDPLPSTIFLSIMGLPLDEAAKFIRFKDLMLGFSKSDDDLSPEERGRQAVEAVQWIQEYFTADLDRRETAPPTEDMIGWMLTAEIDGRRLTRQEMLDVLGLLMIAGLDTVAASLSCMLAWLARNPEQRGRLTADPALWPDAIEEIMRFTSPVTEGYRRTLAEITTPTGTVIPADSFVQLSWAGANLDPAEFDDPLEVDLARSPNRHVCYASGYHRCMGSHLARLELRIAMEAWHERIPEYELAPGTELTFSGNPRAPHTLPLVW